MQASLLPHPLKRSAHRKVTELRLEDGARRRPRANGGASWCTNRDAPNFRSITGLAVLLALVLPVVLMMLLVVLATCLRRCLDAALVGGALGAPELANKLLRGLRILIAEGLELSLPRLAERLAHLTRSALAVHVRGALRLVLPALLVLA